VKAINVKNGGDFSRKEIDDLTAQVGDLGLKGMAYIKVNPDGWQSPIVKFFGAREKDGLQKALDPQPGDLILFGADNDPHIVNRALGWLRKKLAEKLGLIKPGDFKLVWVVDFPMFEYNEEERRWAAMHHPFTSPRHEDFDLLEKDPGKVKALAYDLVLNGNEIGGGSIRNHRMDLQQQVFRTLKIGEEEAREKFGFLLEALSHGAPPHGGIAFGLDRMVMILTGASSLREVIAFPKTQKPQCLMTNAPSRVDPAQLVELHLRLAGVTEEDLK
jgi:aspartyl-tRNA synthetase